MYIWKKETVISFLFMKSGLLNHEFLSVDLSCAAVLILPKCTTIESKTVKNRI